MSVQIEQKSYEMPPRDALTITLFITVADINRSADFYEKVFGGRILSRGEPDSDTQLNARVEWNNIAGSRFHAAAYVRNMLNKQYEVGGVGLGATVGLDTAILGTPRMAALEVGIKF